MSYRLVFGNVYNVLVVGYWMEDGCVFCKIVGGEIPSEKLLENDDFIVIKDVNPKVDGHSLVISKKHYENFLDMSSSLYDKFLETAKEAVKKLGAKDFNLILNNGKIAGQLVPHVHLHILPRKEGDGFRMSI